MFAAIPYNKPFLSQATIFAQEDVKAPLLNFFKTKGNVSKKKANRFRAHLYLAYFLAYENNLCK
jgi:hypothetical protein